ncbi:MAG TPA: lysylphosphatidylglycerol synthase transmembrane domain-containing protein [Gemmatimonadales bacterium]|jgi:uncharacterized membrane protein YbhN (UPF0104 family)|nr:lysylphosphatidylglycerol synthase transmembrane domain-containing protein [Gemmatimonadales bacterium]
MTLRFKVAVSAGLLALLAVVLPWGQVGEAIGRLTPAVWGGVLAGFLFGHGLGLVKWRLLVNAGRARLDRTDGLLCYSAGLFANLCLPSIVGGDVLRMALAARCTRRPEAALLGGVLDRLSDLAGTALLVAGGVLAAHRTVAGWSGGVLTAVLVTGFAALALAVPAAVRRPLARWPRRIRRPLGRTLVALRRLRRQPRLALAALGLSLAMQGGFVLLNAWLGHQLGIAVPLAVWFLVWPLAKLAGLLPISLGGLAVRETTLAALLVPFGVPFAVGVVCSLLWQTVLIAGGLAGGLVWLLLARRAGGAPAAPMAWTLPASRHPAGHG